MMHSFPKRRDDVPTGAQLWAEYENTDATMLDLAVKYDCSVALISKRIQKHHEEEYIRGSIEAASSASEV